MTAANKALAAAVDDSNSSASFAAWLAAVQAAVEARLSEILNRPAASSKLLAAMQYAVLENGKRLRPAMLFAVASDSDSDNHFNNAMLNNAAALDMACALELIHCYSLIHDDLPCMDDDDERRGKPTCHKAHGEAMALLAGDCLQTLAFEVITAPHIPAGAAQQLARAAGVAGMGGGQALDLVGVEDDFAAVSQMYELKTGALFQCALSLGLLMHAGVSPTTQNTLNNFAKHFGLLYQIANDMQRPQHDRALQKNTFSTSRHLDAPRAAADARAQAVAALGDSFPNLHAITDMVLPQ